MTLSLSIATIAWFSKNFTLWSYDYDTFQPKIGQCDMYSTGLGYTMRTNLLNWCNLVSIIKNVAFYAFLVVRIY